ncbi:MAG: hypothetical protein CSA55_00440 [Ilumatobacter coccineus]|uniref:Uncharacterized protein n=1 Tax=Ilumatobacter coccineus TaxID=467094 RepID=A0A2G6KG89_9ACTN|nr:MAG: hypothetical protein CSA55_00440 [Ilumatobacter coccineus]
MTDTDKITADDVREKMQSFQDGLQAQVDEKKSVLATAGGVVLIVVVLVAFLLGKRSGKKKTTLVEIKRV